jgi:hypothetical protein
VLSVAFSADVRRFLFGTADGRVEVWAAPAAWRDESCGELTANMSHQQWREWVSPAIPYIKVCSALPIAPD